MIAAALAIVLGSADLKLDLRAGDQWTCRLEQSFLPRDSTNPAEDEERFTYQFIWKAVGPRSGGYALESSSRLLSHRFGGELLPGGDDKNDLIVRTVVGPDGRRTASVERFSNPDEFRLSRLTWIGFPPAAGSERWKVAWPAVGNFWACGADVEFRRIGKTDRLGRSCALLDVRYAEKDLAPMRAAGTFEVDEESGILLAADLKADDAPLPGGTEPHRLTVKLQATEFGRISAAV